jgi:tRNA-binding protein
MEEITWDDFQKVGLFAGTIISVEEFPEARKPAYKIQVDFGEKIGIKKTSAQVTNLYTAADLIGRQIIGVINFPVKQIGPIRSEFLLTGCSDENGAIVISTLERLVPNGMRLH